MTPLEQLIRAEIATRGPMPLARYMALALQHPEHGYYVTRDPLGRDFTTAPEISQLFGEMVGGWLAQSWIDLGRPVPVAIVELGPGRGTLMRDALRVIARVAGLAEGHALWLVETSPALRAVQAARLPGARHAARLADVPEGPILLVANEFFDALPVAQDRRARRGWQAAVVVAGRAGLARDFAPARADAALDARFPDAGPGTIVERSAAGEAVAAAIGARLRAAPGAALIVDYGDWDGTGDTLQALAGGRFADPFAAPGTADLTAHVRFRALAEAAGVPHAGPLPQGMVLERLGIAERAAALARGKDETTRAALAAGHRRLTDPAAMGHLFKAMALRSPGAPVPAGFAPGPGGGERGA